MRYLNKKVWPFQVRIVINSYSHAEKIINWCGLTCGKEYVDWFNFTEGGSMTTYAFKDEQNLLAFKLTWREYEYGI